MLPVVAGGLKQVLPPIQNDSMGYDSTLSERCASFRFLFFLHRTRFSSSLKHDFAPAAYTRWAECSLGWLGSRPAQMGARGPHNLWSQVQFQAALETEGKIFKVNSVPKAEKDE